jgi:hypothetical protein
MVGKLVKSFRLYLRQEPGADRWQRMWICAVVGILAGTIYAWTISVINLITLPGQHLALDWHRLWFYWGGFSIIAGIEGLFVGWFTENYEGISFGWIPVECLLLLGHFVSILLVKTDPFTASISIIGLLEATGALVFLAAFLRLIANKFIANRNSEDKASRGKRTLFLTTGLLFLILLIGGFARFDISVVRILRSFNDTMTRVVTDTSLESKLPLDTIPELRSHLGRPYKIYPRTDTEAVGTYVFAVIFPDGFSFRCKVPVTESWQSFYFTDCSKSADLSFP